MQDHRFLPSDLPNGVIGRSAALLNAYELAREASLTERHVLIRGPSGCGKTALAKFIVSRTGLHYVKRSCANLRGELLAAELLGYVKGAFTGAIRSFEGLLAQADGGVLILDEIGKAHLDLQERLLTLVEDGLFVPLGSQTPRQAHVRIVAMTSNNLEDLVARGRFLADLLARLETVTLHLPGLAARDRDVLLIADHLLATNPYLMRRGRRHLDPSAQRWLLSTVIPNEVRGLEKLLFQAVMRNRDALTITAEHLERAQAHGAAPAAVHPVDALDVRFRAEEVLRHLAREGACTAAELRQATGTPKSTLGRWLRAWEPHQVIRHAGSPPRYALPSNPPTRQGAATHVMDAIELTALRLAAESPIGVASRDLVAQHSVSSDTARRRLSELCSQGFLEARGQGRGRRYVLTAMGRSWLEEHTDSPPSLSEAS